MPDGTVAIVEVILGCRCAGGTGQDVAADDMGYGAGAGLGLQEYLGIAGVVILFSKSEFFTRPTVSIQFRILRARIQF